MIGGCRSTSAVRNLVASRDGRDEARRQRTHFWSFISIFVQVGGRNIRNLMREVVAGWRLPSSWMTGRLSLGAEIVRKRDLSMSEYDQQLQAREHRATDDKPMPARLVHPIAASAGSRSAVRIVS